jgi:hypothetical protein
MEPALDAKTNKLYEEVSDHMRRFVRDNVRRHPKLIPELKTLFEDPNNTWVARAFSIGMRPRRDHHPSFEVSPILDTVVDTALANIPLEYPDREAKVKLFRENLKEIFADVLTYDTLRKGVLESFGRNPDMVAFAKSSQFKNKYAAPSAPTPYPSPAFAAGAGEPAPQVDPQLGKVVDQLISDMGIPKGAAFPQNKGAQKVIEKGFQGGRRTKKLKRRRAHKRRSTSRRPRA